ncbi:MAG: hypothetical protein E6X92_11130, partial [Clostridiaceae bacterium]|nr:hypothetical protein [Clostridiaceae bacterium]
LGFYTLRGKKFPYGNFWTTLERPTVRSCLSAKLQFRDSRKAPKQAFRSFSFAGQLFGSIA